MAAERAHLRPLNLPIEKHAAKGPLTTAVALKRTERLALATIRATRL